MCRSRWSARISSIRIISPSASSANRSGCVPASTRRSSPSSSPAKARAAARLPTPGGPWKRYACAGPSFTAAASRRRASRCSANALKLTLDPLRERVGVERAVEKDDAIREERRQLLIPGGDALVERGVLPFDAVGLGADAGGGRPRLDREHERPVREQPAGGEHVHLEHFVHAQLPADPLVDDRAVEVAVEEDVGPARERGPDDLGHDLGARRRVEERLGPRRHRSAVEDEVADRLAERGLTRLPGGDDLPPVGLEHGAEELHLRRLPRSVHSLEGDEHRAPRIWPCGRWSPEERASSARTSSMRSWRGATRCTSSTTPPRAGGKP